MYDCACVIYILYVYYVCSSQHTHAPTTHAHHCPLRQIDYINGFIVREAQRLNREQEQQQQQQVGQQLGRAEGQEGEQRRQRQQQGKALLRVPTHEMLLRLIRAAEGGGKEG